MLVQDDGACLIKPYVHVLIHTLFAPVLSWYNDRRQLGLMSVGFSCSQRPMLT